jgi:hypothetical protein
MDQTPIICNILRQPSFLDDFLILTNSIFKYHLLKLEIVLATLSTADMRVNISKSKFFVEEIDTASPDKLFSLHETRFRLIQSLILRCQNKKRRTGYASLLV